MYYRIDLFSIRKLKKIMCMHFLDFKSDGIKRDFSGSIFCNLCSAESHLLVQLTEKQQEYRRSYFADPPFGSDQKEDGNKNPLLCKVSCF